MKSIKLFSRYAVGLLFFLFLIIIYNCSNRQSSKNKIGVVLSLTGRGGTYGERAINGMRLAQDEINKRDYFKVDSLVLYIEDSNSNPKQALSAFKKLIEVEKVQIIIGLVLSDEVLTCAETANQNGVVLLTTAAGSDEIKDAGDFVFRNRESGGLQAKLLADYAVGRMNFNNMGVIHSNSANGIAYKDKFINKVENLGGNVVGVVAYNENNTDYSAEVTQIMRYNPEAVYLAGLDREIGLILRKAGEFGFNPQFFASPGAISEKLIEIGGNTTDGLISASASFDPSDSDLKVKAFVENYKIRFNDTPDFIVANSYDAIYIIANLYENGKYNGEQIKNDLYSLKDYKGVGGKITFDNNGEVEKSLNMLVIKEGKFERIHEYEY